VNPPMVPAGGGADGASQHPLGCVCHVLLYDVDFASALSMCCLYLFVSVPCVSKLVMSSCCKCHRLPCNHHLTHWLRCYTSVSWSKRTHDSNYTCKRSKATVMSLHPSHIVYNTNANYTTTTTQQAQHQQR
jgi:hypothetical protein